MARLAVFFSLFILYIAYSFLVYTDGTQSKLSFAVAEQSEINKGKILFQEHNCISCHQVYGLGGYLGPDLTTAWSDPERGEVFIKTLLKTGGSRMPDFHFTEDQVNAIGSYLKYIDATARTDKLAQAAAR